VTHIFRTFSGLFLPRPLPGEVCLAQLTVAAVQKIECRGQKAWEVSFSADPAARAFARRVPFPRPRKRLQRSTYGLKVSPEKRREPEGALPFAPRRGGGFEAKSPRPRGVVCVGPSIARAMYGGAQSHGDGSWQYSTRKYYVVYFRCGPGFA